MPNRETERQLWMQGLSEFAPRGGRNYGESPQPKGLFPNSMRIQSEYGLFKFPNGDPLALLLNKGSLPCTSIWNPNKDIFRGAKDLPYAQEEDVFHCHTEPVISRHEAKANRKPWFGLLDRLGFGSIGTLRPFGLKGNQNGNTTDPFLWLQVVSRLVRSWPPKFRTLGGTPLDRRNKVLVFHPFPCLWGIYSLGVVQGRVR